MDAMMKKAMVFLVVILIALAVTKANHPEHYVGTPKGATHERV